MIRNAPQTKKRQVIDIEVSIEAYTDDIFDSII